jgi:hypothetical protein
MTHEKWDANLNQATIRAKTIYNLLEKLLTQPQMVQQNVA